MSKRIALTASVLATATLLTVGVTSQADGSPAASLEKQHIARGKYLVTVLGCNDCHTPLKMGPNGPEPDMSRMLSGHPQDVKITVAPKLEMPWAWAGSATNTAFHGPWGTSYARNLTPDEHTGIGAWPKEWFVKAIRTGRHMGTGRPILPPMPWPMYRNLTDEDLESVYAFLQSIPPVENQVPEVQPPAQAPASAPAAASR